jgi:hypothetical protein
MSALLLVAFALVAATSELTAAQRPNILIILADNKY